MTGQEVELRPLEPRQLQAALLEGMGGLSREQVAEAVGVTPKTLTAWGKRQDYQVEMMKWTGKAQAGLETILDRIRLKILIGHELAIDRLVDALDAQDEHDRPYWGVQSKAIEILMNSPMVRTIVDPKGAQAAANAPASAQAVAVVRIVTGEDGARLIEHVVEAEDAEVEEVTDEPGEADGHDADRALPVRAEAGPGDSDPGNPGEGEDGGERAGPGAGVTDRGEGVYTIPSS